MVSPVEEEQFLRIQFNILFGELLNLNAIQRVNNKYLQKTIGISS